MVSNNSAFSFSSFSHFSMSFWLWSTLVNFGLINKIRGCFLKIGFRNFLFNDSNSFIFFVNEIFHGLHLHLKCRIYADGLSWLHYMRLYLILHSNFFGEAEWHTPYQRQLAALLLPFLWDLQLMFLSLQFLPSVVITHSPFPYNINKYFIFYYEAVSIFFIL